MKHLLLTIISLLLFVPSEDQDTVLDAYEEDDSTYDVEAYVMKKDISEEDISSLEEILAYPMMMTAGFESGSDMTAQIEEQMKASLPEGTAQDPGQTPGGDQEDPGQTPGAGDQGDPGQNPQPGTGETDPVGNAGDNGSANIQNSVQGTADVNAVQTGDTANAVPYAAALLAAAAILLGTVLRARMRRK